MSNQPNNQKLFLPAAERRLCVRCGGRRKVKGYDHCSRCKRVIRDQYLEEYRSEIRINNKKSKEADDKAADLREANQNKMDSEEALRLSEQNLARVERATGKEPEGKVKGGQRKARPRGEVKEELKPKESPKKMRKEDFVIDEAEEGEPSDDEISEDEQALDLLKEKGKGKRTLRTLGVDPNADQPRLRLWDMERPPDAIAANNLIDLRAQPQPENHFEEVDIMSMDTEADLTETMPLSQMECTLCANLQDDSDFGTAGCSHTVHRECFETRLPTSNSCPECRTPFGVFVPLPGSMSNFRRLRQRK